MLSVVAPTPPPVVRTILIVDDQESVRLSLEFLLSGCGFRVLSAGSGPEAVAKWEAGPVDGAMIDVHMPIMNGFETCLRLQALAGRHNRPLRVWFMTGAGGNAVEKRSAELGALGVLSKPFEISALQERLESGFSAPLNPSPALPVAS